MLSRMFLRVTLGLSIWVGHAESSVRLARHEEAAGIGEGWERQDIAVQVAPDLLDPLLAWGGS